jgi:hypothetical protein
LLSIIITVNYYYYYSLINFIFISFIFCIDQEKLAVIALKEAIDFLKGRGIKPKKKTGRARKSLHKAEAGDGGETFEGRKNGSSAGLKAWVSQQRATGGVQEDEEAREGFVRAEGWVGETKARVWCVIYLYIYIHIICIHMYLCIERS